MTTRNPMTLASLSLKASGSLSRLTALRDSLKARQNEVLSSLADEKTSLRKVVQSAKTVIGGKRVIRSAMFLNRLANEAEALANEAERLTPSDETPSDETPSDDILIDRNKGIAWDWD